MSGKMPGSIAPSISECAQVHESGLGRTFLRPVTPTLQALGLFRAVSSKGLENANRFPHLFAELVRRGFYDHDIAKIISGNMLCVLRRAEAVGGQLRKARGVIV